MPKPSTCGRSPLGSSAAKTSPTPTGSGPRASSRAYADLGLGLVDASVVAIAERLGATTIATLNHRDFMVVRPRHIVAFELLP